MSQQPEFQFVPFQPPSPEQQAEAARMHEAEHRELDRAWRQVMRFAAIFCTCRLSAPWSFGTVPEPPQVNCPVHSQLHVTHDGKIL